MDSKFVIFVVLASAAQSSSESCLQIEVSNNDFKNEFAAINAVFVKDSFLNQTEIVADLYIAQCALEVATSKIKNAVGAIFTEITDLLIEVSLRIEGETIANLSASDAAIARTATEFTIANNVLLNAVLATQPSAFSTIVAAKKTLTNAIPVVIANYYSVIDVALNQSTSCTKTLENIEAFEIVQSSIADSVIQSTLDVIRNNQTFEAELDSQLIVIQQKLSVSLANAVDASFKAVKVLARAACGNNGVTDNDFRAVENYSEKGISAGVDYIEYIVTAALLAASASFEK